MPVTTVASPPTLGAGRQISTAYPELGFGNSGVQVNGRTAEFARPEGQKDAPMGGAAGWNVATTGAPPAGDGMQIYLNRPTFAVTSNTVPTGRILTPNFGTQQAMAIAFQNVKGTADLSTVEDTFVWSISAILAFDQVPGPITGDLGLTLGVGTRAEIRGTAAFAGIEIGPVDVGKIAVFARQADGGGVTINNQVVPTQPDITKFHKYEFRIVSATATTEAQLKVYIDNVFQLQFLWGAGTLLPDHVVGGAGNLGLTAGLINKNANAATTRMYIAGMGLTQCAAPVDSALF